MTRYSLIFAAIITLCASEPVIAGDWVVHRKTDSVEIFSEYAVNVPDVLRHLNGVKAELSQLIELPAQGSNVQIIIFNSSRSYRAFLNGKIPDAARRRAIFYRNKDIYQVYAFRHQDLITDLRHEYTHALLHQALPYVPLWVDEGVAEFMEEVPSARSGSTRLTGMKWRCRSGWKPDLKSLEQLSSASTMSSAHYRDSWAWVHYLINESPESHGLLKRYLAAISAGEAPGPFTGWSLQQDPEVVKRVGSYFRKFRISLR